MRFSYFTDVKEWINNECSEYICSSPEHSCLVYSHPSKGELIALEIASKVVSVKADTHQTRFGYVARFFIFQKQINRSTIEKFGIPFNKIFQTANLSFLEDQKIVPHCRIASGM